MEIRLLIDHLIKEISLYKEFIAVLQKETENLVSRDYKGLYETVGQKEHIIVRLESMGDIRSRLISAAGAGLGITAEGINLSAIIEKTSGRLKEELKEHQGTVISLIESVKEINKLNGLAVKGSLENINKTLGFLGNFFNSSNYKPTGTMDGFALKGSRLSEGA